LLESGKPQAALERLALLSEPTRRSVRTDEARALLAADQSDRAAATIAPVLIENPWQSEAYLVLGQALARGGHRGAAAFLGRYRGGEAARREEQRALRHEYDGEPARACLVRARSARAQGRWFEAARLFNEARRVDPGLGAAWLELADLT